MASRTCSSSRGGLGDDDPMAWVTTLLLQICLNCSRAQRPKGGRDDNSVTNRRFANRYRVNQYTLDVPMNVANRGAFEIEEQGGGRFTLAFDDQALQFQQVKLSFLDELR